ncbi:MAG: hypothetical protein ABSH48_10885 [Verrucomicrobiota bacterium]
MPKNQLVPELVEIEISPGISAAIKLLPSAEEATRLPSANVFSHVPPELVEIYTEPLAAINRVPSAEEAIELQSATGALLVVHAAPELVERYIPSAVAANLVPSADEATLLQEKLVFALVGVHVWPRAKLAVNRPLRTMAMVAATSILGFNPGFPFDLDLLFMA